MHEMLSCKGAMVSCLGRQVRVNEKLLSAGTATFWRGKLLVMLHIEIHNSGNGPRLQCTLRRTDNRRGIYAGPWRYGTELLTTGYKATLRIGNTGFRQPIWVDFTD
jgi:hypothetical protein